MTDLERFFRRLVANLAARDPARLHQPAAARGDPRVDPALPVQPPGAAPREQRGLRAGRCSGSAPARAAWSAPSPRRRGPGSRRSSRARTPTSTCSTSSRTWSCPLRSEPLARALAPEPGRDLPYAPPPAAPVRPWPGLDLPPLDVARSARTSWAASRPARRRPRRASAEPHCLYCGGVLPADRPVRFCPHCGQRQAPPECPQCHSEVEPGLAALRELRGRAGGAAEPGSARRSGHADRAADTSASVRCTHVLDSTLRPHDVVAVIMGGGAGTRLFPLTKDRAKPAVPLAGKYRLVDIPISNCLNSDLRRIFLLTQFNSGSLHRHIQESYRFDNFSPGFVEILAAEQRIDRTDWYQGTADAVRQNLHAHQFVRPQPGADPLGRPALPDELPHHPGAARRQRRRGDGRHDPGRGGRRRRIRHHGGGARTAGSPASSRSRPIRAVQATLRGYPDELPGVDGDLRLRPRGPGRRAGGRARWTSASTSSPG